MTWYIEIIVGVPTFLLRSVLTVLWSVLTLTLPITSP